MPWYEANMDPVDEPDDMSQTTESTRFKAPAPPSKATPKPGAAPTHIAAMALLATLFFMWGFLTVMNDILIPYFKAAFNLSHFKAMLVQFAFFAAYFVGSLIYFFISRSKGDPIAKIGYQNGIVLGLVISGCGGLIFYPAAQLVSYPLFLGALFILALGITMLQISANPFVAILGPEQTAASRLNLSQGFNSLGTTIAPLIGGYLILKETITTTTANTDLSLVQIPYLVFSAVLFLLAAIFYFVKLPSIKSAGKIETSAVALRFRHLNLGMIAIACYVGAEVCVGSILIAYITGDVIGIPAQNADNYVAIYWGGLMIGRFLGAISSSTGLKPASKIALMIVSAAICFGVIFGAIHIKNPAFTFTHIWPLTLVIAINFIAFFIGRFIPSRTLTVFALCCVALLVTTTVTTGQIALWSVLAVGLFNSIMWSNIFTLAIKGLGKYKSQASSLLVMMIIGGALLPPLQGLIIDLTGNIQISFLLPATCYLYLAYYGLNGHAFVPPKIETLVD
jgi:MFS transporter, FHS family, L-fucose permease